MKKFRFRNEESQYNTTKRRRAKANRAKTRETLKRFNGLIEHEFESDRREKVSLDAKMVEKKKCKAREKRLQVVYASAGIDVGYDASVIADAMSDSYGDPS